MNRLAILISMFFIFQSCANTNMDMMDVDNQPIEVTGIAQDLKGCAIVETETGFYYMDDLGYWDKELIGKRVRVRGILHIVEVKPVKIYEQGFRYAFTQRIIKNAKWEVVD